MTTKYNEAIHSKQGLENYRIAVSEFQNKWDHIKQCLVKCKVITDNRVVTWCLNQLQGDNELTNKEFVDIAIIVYSMKTIQTTSCIEQLLSCLCEPDTTRDIYPHTHNHSDIPITMSRLMTYQWYYSRIDLRVIEIQKMVTYISTMLSEIAIEKIRIRSFNATTFSKRKLDAVLEYLRMIRDVERKYTYYLDQFIVFLKQQSIAVQSNNIPRESYLVRHCTNCNSVRHTYSSCPRRS